MAIIIERTITINNDKATLDKPIYFYIGDGNITCIFTIKEKEKAVRFGTVGSNNIIQDNEDLDYGEAKIYKPDQALVSTNRAEIYDNKLQIDFNWDNMDNPAEAGRHQLQIHLYDSNSGERNRLTIPPVDIQVLLPIGSETALIDEAIVGYSLLDAQAEDVPAFDEEGNYNKTVWQKGDIITSNKLNKIEDALYEINAADSNFVTNEELETELDGIDAKLANKANMAHNHMANNITGLARVATSGSYNDLSNKPTIPNTNNLATKSELAGKADIIHNHDGVYAPTSHTHAGYAANNHNHDEYLTEVPTTYATKTYVRDFVNNSGFITSIPSSFITETELENELAAKGYASEDYVIRKIGEAQLGGGGEPGDPSELLKNYATIAQLNTKADKGHTHDERYLIQSSLDNYATKQYVDDAIGDIESPGGTIDPSILENYPTIDVMNEALAGKADNGHTHTDVYSTIGHTHEDYALKSDIPDMIEIPSNISYFDNDKGYATNTDVSNAITPINEAIDSINENLADYAKKDDIPIIPTNVSEFTNDVGYITSSKDDNDKYYITRIEIVEILPAVEEEGVLYIVKK